jgi:2-dehydro-3-deoxy-D-arabinonate dehydratase
MKIYKTKNGVVAEKDRQFFLLQNENWDILINRDDIIPFLEQQIGSVVAGTENLIADLLPPIGMQQELWACGVTYLKSREGREEESKTAGGSDFYAKVYAAARPEVFFKANPHRIVGHNDFLNIRKDSIWDVPEPELTLVVTTTGKIIGYTIGNDMSSRSIEGENPLYLPQAKTYDRCAALGPGILLSDHTPDPETKIQMTVERAGLIIFEDATKLAQLKRSLNELKSYVYFACSFPFGCLIMTGTGIVPGTEFSLQTGDTISISIDGIGTLNNTVN